MNKEISLVTLWQVFKGAWKIILITVLVATLAVGLYTNYGVQKKYSSSITFYVINTSSNSEYTTSSLMSAIEQLSNDYIEIITSDKLLDPLIEELEKEHGWSFTAKQIRSMITASIISDTSMFELRVTSADSECSYVIAKYINDNAPDIVKNVVKPWLVDAENGEESDVIVSDCIIAINKPQEAKTHNSLGLAKNLVVSAVVSFVIVYMICLIKTLFNTTIKTEDDIKAITAKYPLIGRIPNWTKK